MVRSAAIVSTARTGLAKSYRGGFNATHGAVMLGETIKAAIERAKVLEFGEIDDVFAGCAFPEGATGFNVGRNAALRAGCPASTAGTTINRFCSSGLQGIVCASQHVVSGAADAAIGCGVESISLVQPVVAKTTVPEEQLLKTWPALWMPMIETADILAARYGVSREECDQFSVESQQKIARAQELGLFDDEIIPVKTIAKVMPDKKKDPDGVPKDVAYVVTKDECNRPSTTLESIAKLKPVRIDDVNATVTAGNASQLSDGASTCVVMDADLASKRNAPILGLFKHYAVAGCDPDVMGIGPVLAVPKLLKQAGLTVDDIDLWEINEAFACVPIYAMRTLKIDPAKVNVNGGSIAIGHPFGMTGSRMVGHALLEGQRRRVKNVVVTMCIGGGMGAAALFEVIL